MPSYRNISFATAASLADVLASGKQVVVRGEETKELLGRVTELDRPHERYVFLPQRRTDPIHQFAETMWVLAGRDDVAWLERYLPRAPDFSDDGLVWRGAYGPRLRSWPPGINQINAVRDLLTKDPLSRRAVMALFDPARDYVESKDVPCNNWLSFMGRDGLLHMNVAIRSNDAMWGFSGVNAFEWSVLQTVMAHWLGLSVGRASYFASSFHLYRRHYERAPQIVSRFHGITPYEFVDAPRFTTPWADWQDRLEAWMHAEEQIRLDPESPLGGRTRVGDAFLDSGLELVRLKWGVSLGWDHSRVKAELAALPDLDYVAAAYDYFGRKDRALLDAIPQPRIAAFFDACRTRGEGLGDLFKSAISRLHSIKDRAYGAAWKRRGERVSILPNIARKVDRLEEYTRSQAHLSDESALDTAVDLYVYLSKYRLFLAEKGPVGAYLSAEASVPLSDHDANVDAVIARLTLTRGEPTDTLVTRTVVQFEALWRAADREADLGTRTRLADGMLGTVSLLLGNIFEEQPHLITRFVRAELSG